MIGRIVRKVEFLTRKQAVKALDALNHEYPNLKMESATPSSATEALRSDYQRYVSEVSKADMAISLELAAFMMSLCSQNKFTKLLDLGSGFSSFTFRKYAATNPGVSVFSVDDDAQWLEKTRAFLQGSFVPITNLMTLANFVDSIEEQFDLVLLDLNFVETRKNYISLAIDRAKAGGLIIFDDVHKQDYLADLLKQTAKLPVRLYDIREVTLDQFDRHALLAIKEFRKHES